MREKKNRREFINKSIDIFKFVFDISKSFCILNVFKGMIEGGLQIIVIVYSAYIVDLLVEKSTYEHIMHHCIIFVFLVLFLSIIQLLLEKYIEIKKRYIEDYTKIRIAEKGMKLEYSVLEKQSTMQLLEKAKSGVYANGGITALFTDYSTLIQSFFQIIYSLICMAGLFVIVPTNKKGFFIYLINSPILPTVVCIFVFASVYISSRISSQLSAIRERMFEDCIESNRKFGYFFSFLFKYQFGKDIRMYSMQKLIQKELSECNQDILKVEEEGVRRAVSVTNKNIILNGVIELLVYLIVGIKAIVGLISVGSVVRYVGLIKLIITSMNNVLDVGIMAKLRVKYVHNYCSFVDLEHVSELGTLSNCENKNIQPVIEFRDVEFNYPNNDTKILKGINLSINRNEKVAIVGKNGAGKTTLVKLLCDLYKPTEGEILYEGNNITDYSEDRYTKEIAAVFQDFKLLSYPVGENVACSEKVDEYHYLECMEKAGIRKRFDNKENGIKTYLYNDIEKGIEISGGEAQKIAFARAIYKNPKVLIMDEPTSALDPIAEAEFYDLVKSSVIDQTVIFISHRMSSCKFCDRIIVMDNGKILESGNHDELLENHGLYYELWNAQAKYYI